MFFLGSVSIVVCAGKAVAQSEQQSTLPPDTAIGELLDKTLKEHDLPGLVAAIAKEGQPIRIAAAGVRKTGADELITVFDQIHIGSCTKAMTASMLARLVEQDVLTWKTTIKQVMPELCQKIHSDYHDVTLSQLLMHFGGMPANAKNWWLVGGDNITQRRELIAAETLKAAPKLKPGSKYLYSNVGYMMAGLMAAKATGKSWEQLVQEEVFDPLELKSAGFGPPGTKGKSDQPWGHLVRGKGKPWPLQRDNAPTLGPAGTIHLSVSDWAVFCLQHANDEENQFLLAETLAELHQPDPNSRYAKGWIVITRPGQGTMLTHSGSNTMWHATVWISKKTKTVYIAVANAAGKGVSQAINGVIGGLVRLDR